jgi:DNA excision repair protein ERCC-2
MEIVSGERRVKLSVREFSEFQIVSRPKFYNRSDLWRARLGQEWHNSLRRTTAERYPHATFESTIKGFLRCGGWTFEMEGRLDQMIEEEDHIRVIEIKTTRTPLPAIEEDLRLTYPHYFVQLAAYLALLQATHGSDHKVFRGELLFVDIAGGFPQTIPLERDPVKLFNEQAEHLVLFLEERLRCTDRLRALSFRPPFKSFRPGQKEAKRELERRLHLQTLLFEAPTGFGKTGILLEFGLRRLKEGLCDRLIYLTGKATSQEGVIRHIQAMTPNGKLRFLQIRNQNEHHLDQGSDVRLSPEEMNHRWLASGIKPERLFDKGSVTLKQCQEIGPKIGIAPYEIMRSCLPHADVWIGDYNYVFCPSSTRLIEDLQGFDPKRTLLIIDEAHNLPERVASSLSPRFCDGTIARLRVELRELGNHKALDDLLGDWGQFLAQRRRDEVLDQNTTYEANDLLERFSESLEAQSPPYVELSAQSLGLLFEFSRAARLIQDGCPRFQWAPEDGVLEIACLDAASHIMERLGTFGQCILTSATLEPIDEFTAECGLAPKGFGLVRGTAPWRRGACSVAVDTQADTRYKYRAQHYDKTVGAIRSAVNKDGGLAVAFFPSYDYAEKVRDRLLPISLGLNVMLQPRLSRLDDRIAFLEEAVESADILLLILGSSFSEGIDLLGGKIGTAVVVGPALPAINALREARLESLKEKGRATAFRRVYQIPGIRKVNQAIGRLIRQPGHQAKVLLHGRRFALPEYSELLDPEYRDNRQLHSRDELATWLKEPFSIVS